jgi:hypothetical protein
MTTTSDKFTWLIEHINQHPVRYMPRGDSMGEAGHTIPATLMRQPSFPTRKQRSSS